MNSGIIGCINISEAEATKVLKRIFEPEIDRKFIETKTVSKWEVLSDKVFTDIEAIGKTIEYEIWKIKTETHELKCADTHIVFDQYFNEMFVEDLVVGDKIMTNSGLETVIDVYNTNKKEHMYDLQLSEGSDRRFYTNGILSHNSMWMQNCCVNAADMGFNCVYISLELGAQKCLKRMGSMRLKIDVDEYDQKAKDTIFMKNRINSLRSMNGGMFDSKPGKIFVKKYSTSECTVTDIDNYIFKIEQTKKLKINYVFVDYLSLMGLEKGLDFANMLFLKGKHFAEGLRYIADKYNIALFTGVQTDKAIWNANDINLQNIPESKAIAECCDVCFGIIRNPEMQKHNKYRLKILKFRDGEHNNEEIKFDFNPKFLNMENDEFIN